MRDIVVGIDCSEGSLDALRAAAALARARHRPLRAVSSWEHSSSTPLPTSTGPTHATDQAEREHEDRVRSFVDKVVVDGDGLDVQVKIARGPAVAALLALAKPETTDALVVGSRGLGGFTGLLLGSVSRQLVDHAEVPVVVVRGETVPDELRRVVVALDGSLGSVHALDWATAVAAGAGAEVLAAHAVELSQAEMPPEVADELRASARASLEEWSAPLDRAGVRHSLHLLDGDPRRAILELVQDEGADLVVVGARGTGTLTQLLVGSVADSLVRHSPVPVAVVPIDRPTPPQLENDD